MYTEFWCNFEVTVNKATKNGKSYEFYNKK